MKTYLISYDLGSPETILDYNKIFGAIKSHVGYAKVLKSVWIVKTNRTRQQVHAIIRNVCDYNDKVLIIEVTNDWICSGIPDNVTDWMKRNI
ncbi:TPA: hypothetical protein DCZ15_03095 [Candidatus Falkowbacteria bacterium]|nr:MAG: hypothetical protein UV95_C0002G0005 [Candidatus Falkowbacteria bacterium GW2011_GWF2_43_32]HBA36835.1 hypothetical protein [Candidatus Falkowbacteria bacterium]